MSSRRTTRSSHALDAMGALTDLGPYLEPFPDWLADYEQDVPEAYRHMWNLPKGPAPPGYIAALAPDGNAMMTFYRKDCLRSCRHPGAGDLGTT